MSDIKNYFRKYCYAVANFSVRLFLSLLVSVGVPVICFLLFISFQPRRVIKLDNYLKQTLKEIKDIKISYSHSIITSFRLNTIRFIVNDIKIFKDASKIEIPLAMIDIKLSNFLTGQHIINNIYLQDSNITVINNTTKNKLTATENTNDSFNLNQIGDLIEKYKKYLIVKSINLNNTDIFENNRHINIKNLIINTKSKHNKIIFDIDMIGKLDRSNFDLNINNSCDYTISSRNLNCTLNMLNLSFTDINDIILDRIKNVYKYSDKVFGTFTLKFFVDITNFSKINNIQYFLLADEGSFEIEELFGGKVFFKNFNLSGGLKQNGKDITIKKSSVDLLTENNSDKINHFDFDISTTKNNDVILTILADKIYVQDLDNLWPKILNSQADIRQWVVNAISNGTVEKVDTKLTFSLNKNNSYSLSKVDAIFNLNQTTLNYDKSFPAIKDIIGQAKFTKDDMLITIDTAKSESSVIQNGEVFLDFDILDLSIKANISGQTHDLGHYINYANKKDIEKNLDNYVKGIAKTQVEIVLPLTDVETMFLKSKIFINSSFDIEDNFIFSNNSKAVLKLKKYKDTNTFETTVDLKQSTIDYSICNFIKKTNQATTLYLDIVIDNRFVLLDNIKVVEGDILSLQGRGVIAEGVLQSLNINNIKFNDTNLNVFVKAQDNNFIINILTNKLQLKFDTDKKTNTNSNKNNFTFDNLSNNSIILTLTTDEFFVNNYRLYNLKLYSLYHSKQLKKADIIMFDNQKNKFEYMVENDNKNNNKFSITVDNFGDFLKNLSIINKIKGGNLEMTGNYNNKIITASLLVKDNFDIFYDRENDKLITTIVENEMVSKDIKKKLNRTVFQYKTLKAELNYNLNTNILDIKRYLFDSKNFFTGLNFSGTGNINLSTGKTNLSGAIIPLSAVNSMFGANKIPILDKIFFNDKDGGLFVVGFDITKQNFKSDYSIKINKYDTYTNSAKSLLWLLFLL